MIKNCIKHDLKYSIFSNIYTIFLSILCLLFGIVLFMNYNAATDTYTSYNNSKAYYEKNNIDMDESAPYEIIQNEDTSITISNPIAYYKEKVGQYIYAASPNYTISQMLETSVLFFPLFFGVLGLIYATFDFNYKTIKVRTIRSSKNDYSISKHFVLIFSSVFLLSIALILAKLIGLLMFQLLKNSIPIDNFNYSLDNSHSILIKYIFGCIVAICFAEIGYTLGIIFKKCFIGSILIAIYSLFFNNIGKYDLNNSIKELAKNIFDFYGVINIGTTRFISVTESILVISFVIIFCLITSVLIIRKRTSFVN